MDESGFTLRSHKDGSGKGVAAMQCTDYVKDREEIQLDEELTARRSDLQQTLNERLLQAADAKTRGNQFFQARSYCEALAAYLEGMDLLGASEHAKVLLSARLEGALTALLTDLRSNAAAAALKAEDWEAAIACASSVLEDDPSHAKALYRRASACIARAQPADALSARADLIKLVELQPHNGDAMRLLARLPQPSYA